MHAPVHIALGRLLSNQLVSTTCCSVLAGMRPLVVPVVSTHHMRRRSRDTEMAAGLVTRGRRAKQEQPTLVIMPDGHSLCFAVTETVAHSKPAPDGQALTQHKDVDAHIKRFQSNRVPDRLHVLRHVNDSSCSVGKPSSIKLLGKICSLRF